MVRLRIARLPTPSLRTISSFTPYNIHHVVQFFLQVVEQKACVHSSVHVETVPVCTQRLSGGCTLHSLASVDSF